MYSKDTLWYITIIPIVLTSNMDGCHGWYSNNKTKHLLCLLLVLAFLVVPSGQDDHLVRLLQLVLVFLEDP